MNNETKLNQKTDRDFLTIPNKSDDKIINSKDLNNSRYTLTSKEMEDSSGKREDNDDNMNITENISFKEKQLSLLLETFENIYSKKSFRDLIIDIEEKENLLNSKSLKTFEIKILKIKSLLKLLMEEYNIFLQSKNKHFHELDFIIQKIKNEFNILSMLIIDNDSYEFETTTQTYCKFLYLLSKISIKREDYLKSLGYITLGINMLKIYFMKEKVASNINTYKIYCKLVLEVINILIGDQNYEQALYYIRLLFKLIEISIKYIYNNNDVKKQKIPDVKIKKFIIFGAIGYIYTGCCLEQFNDPIQAFEAYREAKIFLKKGSKLGFSFQSFNSINISNSCSFLVDEVFEKLKLKFKEDKIDRLNKQKRLELQRKKEANELLQNEKLMKLRYIAYGLGNDPFKLEKAEKKLNKKLFPSSVVNNLEKIDDELTSFVFTYLDNNKKDNISSYNTKMSLNTKNNISRYEMHNILMSRKFREFIMKNKKLQFYNPKTSSNSISIIQRHLNDKIQIQSIPKQKSVIERKSFKLKNNYTESSRTDRRINTQENYITYSTSSNSRNKNKVMKDNIKFLLSQDTTTNENNSQKKINLTLNTTRSTLNKKFKFNLDKNYNLLQNDFERKHLDKNLTTKNYLRKYFHYDKLSDKELKFQKLLLHCKFNNTLYNKNRTIEDKDGLIGKDEITNMSIIVNEKAKYKPIIEKNSIDLNLLKGSFGSKQNQISLKMKSAMSSVISKYISERKSRIGQQNLFDNNKIKKINEKKILILDNSIKNINNNISNIKHFLDKQKIKIILSKNIQ